MSEPKENNSQTVIAEMQQYVDANKDAISCIVSIGYPRLEKWIGILQAQEQTPPRAVESIALKPGRATPLTLHRAMGEARGLIQTAIGQVRDLDIPHVGEYLWGASHELDRAVDLIRHALASITAPALAPKEFTSTPEGRPAE